MPVSATAEPRLSARGFRDGDLSITGEIPITVTEQVLVAGGTAITGLPAYLWMNKPADAAADDAD
ncbi:MAG: hypothetical protein IPK66_16420 [Rhodospirillales bacterium]|nr:hypothetical protein [Rhodospirillales bacterium]